MSAAKKKDKGSLSQIAADLFTRSREGEEPSFDINHLRGEIIKEVEGSNEIFRQFRGLVESLRSIIPEEEKCYRAAIKTLSTTSGLSGEDILKAADRQLAELKTLKEGLMSALPDWRDDLKAMEARSSEITKEISKLRETIMQLETEQQEMLDAMSVREKEMELAEKGLEDVLANIEEEVMDIREKIEEAAAQRAEPRPAKPVYSDKSHKSKPAESQAAGGNDLREVAPRQDVEEKKKCPLCGGQMDWYLKEKMWKCFVCAYEEVEKAGVAGIQGKTENPPEAPPARADRPAEAVPPEYVSGKKRPVIRTKSCPVCKKKMDWQAADKSWRCPFCQYQRMEL